MIDRGIAGSPVTKSFVILRRAIEDLSSPVLMDRIGSSSIFPSRCGRSAAVQHPSRLTHRSNCGLPLLFFLWAIYGAIHFVPVPPSTRSAVSSDSSFSVALPTSLLSDDGRDDRARCFEVKIKRKRNKIKRSSRNYPPLRAPQPPVDQERPVSGGPASFSISISHPPEKKRLFMAFRFAPTLRGFGFRWLSANTFVLIAHRRSLTLAVAKKCARK